MDHFIHDRFLQYGETLSEHFKSLPLILVIGGEPLNQHPFASTIGRYELVAKQPEFGTKATEPFSDPYYGMFAKNVGMRCAGLKAVVTRVGASPIVFADVMPAAAPAPAPTNSVDGSVVSPITPAAARERAILTHHATLFEMINIMERVTVLVCADHQQSRYSKHDAMMRRVAMEFFTRQCVPQYPGVEVITTTDLLTKKTAGYLDVTQHKTPAEERIHEAVCTLLELGKRSVRNTG